MLIEVDFDGKLYKCDAEMAEQVLDMLTMLCNRIDELELQVGELEIQVEEYMKPWESAYVNRRQHI